MTRLMSSCLCACLALSLTAMACGSSGSSLPSGWDQARIGNTGVSWWVNALKSAYFFSVKITPSSQDDTLGRSTVITFTQKVVGGLKSGSPAPQTLVPAADESSGWTLDPNNSKTANGVQVATDSTSATNLIDGGAEPFFTSSYQAKALAWEVYTNGTYSMDLMVWQMASAKDATSLYTDLLQNSLYSQDNANWVTCTGNDPNNPCPAQ